MIALRRDLCLSAPAIHEFCKLRFFSQTDFFSISNLSLDWYINNLFCEEFGSYNDSAIIESIYLHFSIGI